MLNWEKKKEKNKTLLETKAKVLLRVLVLVLVITFIIDSHTIKRGNLWLNGLLSATR